MEPGTVEVELDRVRGAASGCYLVSYRFFSEIGGLCGLSLAPNCLRILLSGFYVVFSRFRWFLCGLERAFRGKSLCFPPSKNV